MPTLKETYDVLSEQGLLGTEIPDNITNNLNHLFELREYQLEAIRRFIYNYEKDKRRIKPTQLLFHMATGSGKTLLMAANILYLYEKGYRNFLFFVNSTNIIEKTKDNFLNLLSSKYLFNEHIKFGEKEVFISPVENFEGANPDAINIHFTTIQGLHCFMNTPRENSMTYEDFKDKKIVIISDEAHHINAWTKNKLGKEEKLAKTTWEHTVNNIFNSNLGNIMLEYTATVDLSHPAIRDKYDSKIIYDYSLKQFRLDGYSKEVKVMEADLKPIERTLQSVILSQYRRKIAEKHKKFIKPVILLKSRTIDESTTIEDEFKKKIKSLKISDISKIKNNVEQKSILNTAFNYFEENDITLENLVSEIKEEFHENKCLSVNSKSESEKKQLLVNSLEDKDNEIRVVFAVGMLNEGWDVLNLFDIVRLYDTRDAKAGKPGKTTIAEAQLIGRGARYFPFTITDEQERFKRKYDEEPNNELKILEELYYHSAHNPRYIQELTTALVESGIMPPEKREIHLKVKDGFKKSDFWSNGLIFINEKKKSDRTKIKDISDLDIDKLYKIGLRTGYVRDSTIFNGEKKKDVEEKRSKIFKLNDFGIQIMRKSLTRLDFYKFNNLKKYFPKSKSISKFIEALKDVQVEVTTSITKLDSLNCDDKLEICTEVLKKLQSNIESGYTEYVGTILFKASKIKDLVEDKIINIAVNDTSDKEIGIGMSETLKLDLRLDLKNKDWYVYEENYGTSEEKYFVRFINDAIDKLQKRYSDIYLLRNQKIFQLYRFSDGNSLEPDFVLFLKEKKTKQILYYQVFIEPKGSHLLEKDDWKQQFLTNIEGNYQIEILAENTKYKIIGLPFYNEDLKTNFIGAFNEKLELKA
ncbi:MAG: DEAD/DEAH box helicase family protein [Candidatus Thermoplasmatota archaeon]|nr:DEAD/DEAH box helicase family protein [Candidatus Thermoplasmatota archaeon]